MQTAVFIIYFAPGPSASARGRFRELRRTRRSPGEGGHPQRLPPLGHLSTLAGPHPRSPRSRVLARSSRRRSLAAMLATTVRSVSRLVSLEQEGRVGAAEAEGVRERVLDAHGAPLVRHVVEIALGVGMLEVGRRRRHLMV